MHGTGRGGQAIWGGFILALGVWWLLGAMGLVRFSWAYAGPMALIVVGLGMVLRHCPWGPWGHDDEEKPG